MEGISQVQFDKLQSKRKKRAEIYTGLSLVSGGIAGVVANNNAKSEIAEYTKKLADAEAYVIDKAAIRQRMANLYGNSSDFFEKAAKSAIHFEEVKKAIDIKCAKEMLESVKAYHKFAPIVGFVTVAVVSALAFISIESLKREMEKTPKQPEKE